MICSGKNTSIRFRLTLLHPAYRPQQLLWCATGCECIRQDERSDLGGRRHVCGQYETTFLSPATFTAGLEYQNNSLHDVMTGYHRDMKQDVRIASAFVQNEWKMNQFVFLVGVRLDEHNLIDNPIFSPRLNLLYKPSDRRFSGTYYLVYRFPCAAGIR